MSAKHESKRSTRKSTTLKDVTGKLIREGDIIEYPTYSSPNSQKRRMKPARALVVWLEAYIVKCSTGDPINYPPRWDTEDLEGFEGYRSCDWTPFFKCRIVGKV